MEDNGESILFQDDKAALEGAVKLLRNTSAQISHHRRRKILIAVNLDIKDLVEAWQEDIFQDATAELFGSGFELKMKEKAESIKLFDILIMAGTAEQARDHTLDLTHLFENQLFIIYPEKSLTTPTQVIQFLGIEVDSQSMELRVPGQKLKKT